MYYNDMQLKVKKVHPDAKLPTYGTPGDAGMDFYSLEEVVFQPGELKSMRTGIAVEIPEGNVGLIWDKSKIGFQHGLKTLGGVIDSGFRGEIFIALINLSGKEQVITAGQKFTQMLIQPIMQMEITEAETLSETVRGEGREGSTGTH